MLLIQALLLRQEQKERLLKRNLKIKRVRIRYARNKCVKFYNTQNCGAMSERHVLHLEAFPARIGCNSDEGLKLASVGWQWILGGLPVAHPSAGSGGRQLVSHVASSDVPH